MNKKAQKRSYPPIYEKTVPLAIAILAVTILAVLVYTVAVGLGVINFG